MTEPSNKQLNLFTLIDSDRLPFEFQEIVTHYTIPGSGLCWIVSFLIGLFLSIQDKPEQGLFAEIISELPGCEEFANWITDGTFVSNGIPEPGNDTPLWPLIDAIKTAILSSSTRLCRCVVRDFKSYAQHIRIPNDDFEHEFAVGRTNYGSFFSIRILQKYFEQQGLKTNVVICANTNLTKQFSDSTFNSTISYDSTNPTIVMQFTGIHFNLVASMPIQLEKVLCHDDSQSIVVSQLEGELDTIRQELDTVRQKLRESKHRLGDSEQTVCDLQNELDSRGHQIGELKTQVQQITSHATEVERQYGELLDDYLSSVETKDSLSIELDETKRELDVVRGQFKEACDDLAKSFR